MPNLIAGRAVVPELLQEDADPARIAEALLALLAGPAREGPLAALAEVRAALGGGGAAARAAAIAEEMTRGAARP
jgi:lipid-A-disaccharide synthase